MAHIGGWIFSVAAWRHCLRSRGRVPRSSALDENAPAADNRAVENSCSHGSGLREYWALSMLPPPFTAAFWYFWTSFVVCFCSLRLWALFYYMPLCLQPQFMHLALIWTSFQDEMVLLSVLSNILVSLEPFTRVSRPLDGLLRWGSGTIKYLLLVMTLPIIPVGLSSFPIYFLLFIV